MKLLVIGGTRFVGRFVVEEALKGQMEVTLFHRGHTPSPFGKRVEEMLGDRVADVHLLKGRTWDAVVDTCGYLPWEVEPALAALKDTVRSYVFISSQSVYKDHQIIGLDEEGEVTSLPPEKVEELRKQGIGSYDYYGPMKALIERKVEQCFPGRALVVRPGLVVGPYDYSDRFSYWVKRVSEGSDMLVPAIQGHPVQWIDGRDLARWIIRAIQGGITGVFNAVGPAQPTTFGAFIQTCLCAVNSQAHPVWVDEDFLLKHGVKPWTEMPLWIPDSYRMQGFMQVKAERAQQAGLTFRPLEETIGDTLKWIQTEKRSEWQAGITPERERELLAAWKKGESAASD